MRARHERGFTLVELLVVIVILGVTAGVVVPTLRPPAASRTTGALLNAYGEARREAAVRGVVVSFQLDVRDGEYLLLTRAGPGVPVDTIRAGALRMPPGVTLAGGWNGRAVATFDPLGPAHGDLVTVRVDKEAYEIAIDPWTAVAGRRRL